MALSLDPAEGTGVVLEGGRLVAFEINREDVEARLHFPVRDLAHVVASQSAQDPAFALVDGHLGGGDGACCPGLHLDKAECLALPRNQVKIAGRAGGMPVAGDYDVAAAHEPEKCGAFAFDAGFEVRGVRGLAADGCAIRHAVEGADRRFHEIDAEFE